ncbi:MAG: DUF4476 domain-containing protein [Crocinitomicaceae bacterium]|nr:DUF4476 domain-containing protein [Crocinitomicaceae bacterium]
MKSLKLLFIGALLSGCVITDQGIGINSPQPDVFICLNAVSTAEAEEMKDKIDSESFPDDRLERGKFLAKDRCFQVSHDMIVLDAFIFDSKRLEMAKYLYNRTENKSDYDIVISSFTFKSDRDELRDYIEMIEG